MGGATLPCAPPQTARLAEPEGRMDRTQCATSDVTVEPDSFSNSQDGHARGAGVSGGAALISVASAKDDSGVLPRETADTDLSVRKYLAQTAEFHQYRSDKGAGTDGSSPWRPADSVCAASRDLPEVVTTGRCLACSSARRRALSCTTARATGAGRRSTMRLCSQDSCCWDLGTDQGTKRTCHEMTLRSDFSQDNVVLSADCQAMGA